MWCGCEGGNDDVVKVAELLIMVEMDMVVVTRSVLMVVVVVVKEVLVVVVVVMKVVLVVIVIMLTTFVADEMDVWWRRR